jgi:hypothetical protein
MLMPNANATVDSMSGHEALKQAALREVARAGFECIDSTCAELRYQTARGKLVFRRKPTPPKIERG